ncbi:hypothetical protein [Mycobacterium sp.]|uniref:hypothetical protein n=1 Tax=Mycobacterium sp. TaxID=1785 RepID=UPI0031E0D5B0
MLLALAGLLASTAPSHADDQPVLHHVKYTLTADNPIHADIYYLDQEPPVFSDYSHDPYQFVPNIQADVGPTQPWSYQLDLANPYQWAFFTASTGGESSTPMFHCQLMVDGGVVATQDRPKGVLCSMRPW